MASEYDAAREYAVSKRNRLIGLLVSSAIVGLFVGAAPVWGQPISVLYGVAFLVVVVQWTYIDAAERGFELWPHFILQMVVCPGVFLVMPVYFICSRGWKRGLTASGIAMAFFLLHTAIMTAFVYFVSSATVS